MTDSDWRRLAIGISLVVFLIGVYFFTFNGYAISRDEWFLFDATESMARRGNLRVNYEFDAYPPLNLKHPLVPSLGSEPMQPILATPLFWGGEVLPDVGLVHTVWLFNVLVTALTAGVLYAYGLALGYRARVAALAALAFGVGTIAWPYSRTFFREPLFTLLTLLSVYFILQVRRRLEAGKLPVWFMAAFGLAFVASLFTKEAFFLAWPVIVVVSMPVRWFRLPRRRAAIVAITLAGVLVLLLVAINADTLLGLDSSRYAIARRIEEGRNNISEALEGLKGYMVSPGRSIWVFSPVLLLGFVGIVQLIRQRRRREVAVPAVMLVSFVVGYALIRGPNWHGGTGWGARYLVPVTPFLALWLLPVFASVQAARRWWLAIAPVMLVSVGVQLLGVLVPLSDYTLVNVKTYYGVLATENPLGVSWQDGVWDVRWSPLYVAFDLLGEQRVDVAWQYAVGDTAWLPVLALGLALAALACLGWWIGRERGSRRAVSLTAGGLTLLAGFVLWGGIRAIRYDPRYYGDFTPARNLLAQLEQDLQPDDVVVLNDFTYNEFFMNYYKMRDAVVYTLPQSPGQRATVEQALAVVSADPNQRLHLSDTLILAALARQHDRLWLVLNSGRHLTGSIRPVEHYLSRHYFPVTEVPPSDEARFPGQSLARAVLFEMTPAPQSVWPAQRVEAVFGDSLRLVGYDVPGRTVHAPGDVVPVSLLWEAVSSVPRPYTVGLFLMSPDGALLADRNSFPVNYFENTATWRPGAFYRDNHGLLIPATVPPGTYELWVVLYWWQQPAPGNRLPVTAATGAGIGQHVVLTTITVE
jgi:hypothetical protein